MKARIITVSLLLLLALGTIAYLNGRLSAQALPVELEVLAATGDKRAAQGLTVDYRISLNRNLRWYTQYDPASGGNDAVFGMSYRRYERMLRVSDDNTYQHDWKIVASVTDADDQNDPVTRDVRSKLEQAGESGGDVRVYPADYYDTYPMYLSWYGEDDSGFRFYHYGDEIMVPFSPLRIPVGKADFFELYFSFNSYDGEEVLSASGWSNYYMENRFATHSLGCENGVLATVGFAAGTEPEPDWAPEGFGLWYIPVYRQVLDTGTGTFRGYIPAVEECRLVYPLDIQRQKVVLLRRSLNGEQILLITAEEGKYVLHVLDAADFSLIQRLELDTVKEQRYSITDFMQNMLGEPRTDISNMPYRITETSDGTQIEAERVDFGEVSMQQNDSFTAVLLGSRLVLLTPSGEGFQLRFACDTAYYGLTRQKNDSAATAGFFYDRYEGEETQDYCGVYPTVDKAYTMVYNGSLLAVAGYCNDADMLLSIYGENGLQYGALVSASLVRQCGSGSFRWEPLWQDVLSGDADEINYRPQPSLLWGS